MSSSPFIPFFRRFADERQIERGETIALYNEVSAAHRASQWAVDDIVEVINDRCAEVFCKHFELPPYRPLAPALDQCQKALIALERAIVSMPRVDWESAQLSIQETVELREALRSKKHFLENSEEISRELISTLVSLFADIVQALPRLPSGPPYPLSTSPLITQVKAPNSLVETMIGRICTQEHTDTGLFVQLREILWRNVCRASGIDPDDFQKKRLIPPTAAKLRPVELVDAYLAGTPFVVLLLMPIPYGLTVAKITHLQRTIRAQQLQVRDDPSHPYHRCYQCGRLLPSDAVSAPWQDLRDQPSPLFHTEKCKETSLNRHRTEGTTEEQARRGLINEYRISVRDYEAKKRTKEAEQLQKQRALDEKERLKQEAQLKKQQEQEAAEAAELAAYEELIKPKPIPDKLRFEGTWVLAPPGSGKSQLLQSMIAKDLERVVRNEATIVVMESTRDLINNVANLKIFAPGQPLHGKLVIIKPNPDYPLALNPFDIGIRNADRAMSSRDREVLFNSGMELLQLVFSSILGSDLTKKQAVPFKHVLTALVEIPNATIHTLRDFFEPGGYQRHKHLLTQLDRNTVRFFETQYDADSFRGTRQEVLWRLDDLATYKTFMRMFSAPQCKFDFYDELNSSKVILINTDLDLLKRQQTEAFGRFFLAMLMHAIERRSRLPRDQRRTVSCYVDECHDYITDDASITTLLGKGRKCSLAAVLAHQRLDQLSNEVKSALSNVAIRYSASPTPMDVSFMEKALATSAEFLAQQTDLRFAVWARGVTSTAFSMKSPFLVLENMPKMSQKEQDAILGEMHERYSYKSPAHSPTVPSPSAATSIPPISVQAQSDTNSPKPPPVPGRSQPPTVSNSIGGRNPRTEDPGEPSSEWRP